MADLIIMTLENGDTIRFSDLNDAKLKAISIPDSKILVEIIPEGQGGLVTTLEFDRDEQDWIPA